MLIVAFATHIFVCEQTGLRVSGWMGSACGEDEIGTVHSGSLLGSKFRRSFPSRGQTLRTSLGWLLAWRWSATGRARSLVIGSSSARRCAASDHLHNGYLLHPLGLVLRTRVADEGSHEGDLRASRCDSGCYQLVIHPRSDIEQNMKGPGRRGCLTAAGGHSLPELPCIWPRSFCMKVS